MAYGFRIANNVIMSESNGLTSTEILFRHNTSSHLSKKLLHSLPHFMFAFFLSSVLIIISGKARRKMMLSCLIK